MTARKPARKQLPDPPSLPAHLDEAPARLCSGDLLDGVRVDGGFDVPGQVDGAELRESVCVDVDFSGRRLVGFSCRDVRFERCDLSGAMLDSASLTRVEFIGCRMTGVVLSGATLQDVRIHESRADLANLRMARASFLLIENTSLREAEFYRASVERGALLGCELARADFRDASLTDVDLHGSDLEGISGADSLRGASIGPDQLYPLASVLLAAAGITVTDHARMQTSSSPT